MLLVGFGEGVTAGPVSNKVQLPRARRIGGSLERGAARIGNRARRQTADDICIVRRRLFDLGLGEWTTERTLAANQAVDDGRVRLQLHVLLQPIDEDCSDARTLVGLAGLLFDDRGK